MDYALAMHPQYGVDDLRGIPSRAPEAERAVFLNEIGQVTTGSKI